MKNHTLQASEATKTAQEQAIESTFLITKCLGPTCFQIILAGENANSSTLKSYKVRLGEIHTCSCKNLIKNSLCVHISWILLKYLKLSTSDHRSWQLGLPYREIDSLLLSRKSKNTPKEQTKKPEAEKPLVSNTRNFTVEDVCPICQESLLSVNKSTQNCSQCEQPVHLHCIKVWADHQVKPGENVQKGDLKIQCPCCRGEFCSFSNLRSLLYSNLNPVSKKTLNHPNTLCDECGTGPIRGRLYRNFLYFLKF